MPDLGAVDASTRRPNILLIVSDQERNREWLPTGVELPWRERLLAQGCELANYWTHSSPCSPSRATMMTGRYLPGHRVLDNVILPWHTELDTGIPTVGKMLRDHAGYRSSYIGKWHLSQGSHPNLAAYGYGDWAGDDRHFMGWAGTGVHFDPLIARSAATWLGENATRTDAPWFLTVAMVNPHDVMWFPIDQPDWRASHPQSLADAREFLAAAQWKDDDPLPAYAAPYPEIVDELPANFHDDLHTKPDAHRAWRHSQQHGVWGYIDPADKRAWLRQLDYYVQLQRLADESLGTVLGALEASGQWEDTIVIFTSDHGDMCGGHGLRSKGPFVYNEIMRVPCYVRVPGRTRPGSVSNALASHVDLAPTICRLAGVDPSVVGGLDGVDLGPLLDAPGALDVPGPLLDAPGPLLDAPGAAVREHVLFAQDAAHTATIRATRYALRGVFDGRYKYARYYGIGGGKPNDDFSGKSSAKLYDVDADFDDCDHELYDLTEDPGELVNLANDRGRRGEVRERFERLRATERLELERSW